MALTAPAIEPKYLPPNAEMALTLNLKQIVNSELFQDKKVLVDTAKAFVQGKLEETPLKEYFDKAGFDLFRDLHSVTITTDGSKDLDSLFIAVEGNFNTEKWVDLAKSAARDSGDVLKVTKNGNVNIFELTPRANEKTIYAGLIGDSVLVAAPTREALNATITRVKSNEATLKPGFKKLLETTSNKQSFSMVTSGTGIAKGLENAPRVPGGDIGGLLAGLDGLSFSITLTKDITFQLAGAARDEESAKQMASQGDVGLRLAKAFLTQKANEDDKMQLATDVLNTLKITTQGSNVILRGAVTQRALDKLLSFRLQ
jgi:hypothetical protein